MRDIGSLIKGEMEAAGMTILELAAASGVSRATISAIIHGRRPVVRTSTIERLSRVLQQKVDNPVWGGAPEILATYDKKFSVDAMESMLETLHRGLYGISVVLAQNEQGEIFATVAKNGKVWQKGMLKPVAERAGSPQILDLSLVFEAMGMTTSRGRGKKAKAGTVGRKKRKPTLAVLKGSTGRRRRSSRRSA